MIGLSIWRFVLSYSDFQYGRIMNGVRVPPSMHIRKLLLYHFGNTLMSIIDEFGNEVIVHKMFTGRGLNINYVAQYVIF